LYYITSDILEIATLAFWQEFLVTNEGEGQNSHPQKIQGRNMQLKSSGQAMGRIVNLRYWLSGHYNI